MSAPTRQRRLLAVVIEARHHRADHVVELVVRCPNGCRYPHTHGTSDDFDSGERFFGHRVAHCPIARADGYWLADPDGLAEEALRRSKPHRSDGAA